MYTWHMICYMWHMTSDMWQVVGVNILSKFQLPSGLVKTVFWRLGGKGWLYQLINDKGVSRTALATPGLLNMILRNFDICIGKN